ncbi:glycosyltransferase [Pectobacterium aroidearum]|uniref:glycosyltransferase n=1 Tax=Pectobacterium aroidearum TaxID=1201031 RepID=UPI0015F3B548|nr:glycosyltransferase [Pectobacterium aroidearum]MBA5599880.1 glycosyltransferase [Pectobacterium aroidearum]
MNNEIVSIYIPTHNRKSLLERAILSASKQTYKNIEIIVCDDGSTDGTTDLVSAMMREDARIAYCRNDVPQGACSARNLGIFSAKGRFITGLDDDDEFTESRIENFLDQWNDSISFICSNFKDSYPDKLSTHYIQWRDKIFEPKTLLYSNIASNQIFTLTERLQGIGGFDVNVRRLQDWDTWLRIAFKFGPFLRLKDSTYIMHHEHENTTRVSNSYGLDLAFLDFMERNNKLLTKDSLSYLKFHISRIRKAQNFSSSLYWAIRRKNPLYLMEVFKK